MSHLSLLHRELICRFGAIDAVFYLMQTAGSVNALEEVQKFLVDLSKDNPAYEASRRQPLLPLTRLATISRTALCFSRRLRVGLC